VVGLVVQTQEVLHKVPGGHVTHPILNHTGILKGRQKKYRLVLNINAQKLNIQTYAHTKYKTPSLKSLSQNSLSLYCITVPPPAIRHFF
jgi:mRNA-degrading endonuclease RelE of RelBE toxin-antitoxin system